jgi:hypothetical protein
MSSIARSVTTQVNRSGCQQANRGQTIGEDPQRLPMQPGRPGSEERNERMRTTPVVGMSHSILRPACACRRCRARRARCTPRIVESTLVTEQPLTAGWKQQSWHTESQHVRHLWAVVVANKLQSTLPGLCLRNVFAFSFIRHTAIPRAARMVRLGVRSRWGLSSVGLLLLVLLLLTGMGMLWDLGPLAPLLFQPTATVTIVPTRLDSQATPAIVAVTGTPDPAEHEVAARFVSATSPVLVASGQASGVAHVPATVASGTLTFYNAATYPQTIAAGTVLTGADGLQVVTDAATIIPAGNPPLFGVVTVSAHTLQAGSRDNIAALDIDGLCCVAGVAVKNTADFSGGQDAQTYTTVRQADIDGLARPLIDTLTQDAQAGVRSQLHPQEWVVTLPACSNAVNADHPAGSRATQVTVTVAVTCRVEVYDQQAALRLAATSLKQETSATLGSNYALEGQVTTTLVGVTVTDLKQGTLMLSIEAEGVWVYQWSSAHLEALARQIAGAQKQEALALVLREEGVQAASIRFSGGEGTALPADPSQILITVAGEQTIEGGIQV